MNKNIKVVFVTLFFVILGVFIFKMSTKKTMSELLHFNQKWNPESYNKHALLQFEIAMQALSKWNFSGNENVLDIGCGDGEISYELATKFVPNGSVLGIDISENMINFAKNKYKVKNLSFKVLNATDIDFKNEFDLITSFYCIHWIKDKQKLLNGMFNALKENGKILLYIMDCIDKCDLAVVLHETLSMPKWADKFKGVEIPWFFTTEKEFAEIVKNSGLKLLTIKTTSEAIYFKNIEALNDWIKSVPLANHLSHELRDEFFKDMQTVYLKYAAVNANGSVKFGLPTLIVIAQKS